jgi:predicted secreted Zn-dependent protease
LEFSASVGFIHKEYVTMHNHTILKQQNGLKEAPNTGVKAIMQTSYLYTIKKTIYLRQSFCLIVATKTTGDVSRD